MSNSEKISLPGCDDAKDECPAGCQSWVCTTCLKFLAKSLMRGTTSSASGTASFPPAQKSYCMSTTRSTSFSLVCMGTSLGKGSGASLESWKPVYNDINGNGTHDIRQFPLILKYRPEGSALQFINYGWRNATREIDAPASLQCHGRIAGNSRQPRDKM